MKSFLPVSASDHASQVDHLFVALTAISGGVVLLLVFLILFNVIRYRAGSGADRSPLRMTPRRLEILWTILPAFVFIGFFAWGASLYLDHDADGDTRHVYVIGRQWMWEMRYPDGRREHNLLHVPLGKPVHLIMTSEDVIHSFYIPALRMKQDLVPGRYVSMSFTPTREGDYPIYCAQYCGTKHSAMIGTMTVMKPQAYQRWLEIGTPIETMAAEGKKLFFERGCAGCHDKGSAVRAPELSDFFGKPVALQDGTSIKADEAYLRDSILLPLKNVTAGFDPVMPSYQGQLDEAQVIALIEYIKSRQEISNR